MNDEFESFNLFQCRNNFESNLVLSSNRISFNDQRLDVLGNDPDTEKNRSRNEQLRNRKSQEGTDGQVLTQQLLLLM